MTARHIDVCDTGWARK